MAIVEDEVRHESEEDNEIEVVVEEDDGDRESDDSEFDDDQALENKVAESERILAENPNDYYEHMELIKALWRLSELDRWRAAFQRLKKMFAIYPDHWLMWLQTETSLAHTKEAQGDLKDLFQSSTLDCYSIPILSEWCTWSLSTGNTEEARANIDIVLKLAGADPMSGKMFWDAKLELEKTQLETISENDAAYKKQQERILYCLEEIVSRPLLHGEKSLKAMEELALQLHDQAYVDKVKKQHECAMEFFQKISPYEDKLLIARDVDERFALYQEYIDTVNELSNEKKYDECGSDAILKILYNRLTTQCKSCPEIGSIMVPYFRHMYRCSSSGSYARFVEGMCRRFPLLGPVWVYAMQLAERDNKDMEQVKTLLERAMSKALDTYNDAEMVWMAYLQCLRRNTDFEDENQVEKLRLNFRMAWDTLGDIYGPKANDSDVALYWARLEYGAMNDPKRGKEVIEEIFKYGENKTLSKIWEVLIHLESHRNPPPSVNKRRDLFRRALRFVSDCPFRVGELWTAYEQEYGTPDSMIECFEAVQVKYQEFKNSFGPVDNIRKSKSYNKKNNNDKMNKSKKDKEQKKTPNKRKGEQSNDETQAKKKRENNKEDDKHQKETVGGGVKRVHGEEDKNEASCSKRLRTEEEDGGHSQGTRDACTLFVSNLDFKVGEEKLRSHLAQYGEIVALRVKAGVKAFGGSICYCQYKAPDSVEEALKHDRTPLDGRPMFFSRYSAKKSKASFKYSTEPEKNKLFVKNLPFSHCTKEALTELFEKYGSLKDVRVVTFKDGKPKGLAYIDFEEESAASAAVAQTDGSTLGDRKISVALSAPPPKDTPTTLGQPKRDPSGGMRRTQLSSFIPRVLQKPSTSSANVQEAEAKPLSNSDFRNMLLNK
ncbi:hypothetical protein ACJJTC_006090 [Scirpophaga incertulas]